MLTIGSAGNFTLHAVTIKGGDPTDPLAAFFGGGIYNRGNLSLTNTTVTGNRSEGVGGGVFNEGTLTLIDSNISGNNSPAGCGGLI